MLQASGRQWKEAGERAGSLRSENISSSWEEKMRLKAETKMFRENRAQAIATRTAKLQVGIYTWLHGFFSLPTKTILRFVATACFDHLACCMMCSSLYYI